MYTRLCNISKELSFFLFGARATGKSSLIKFALTGSSARKLKKGSANLLAGRAVVYSLFPLTAGELNKDFDLMHALTWGTLPHVVNTKDIALKRKILQSYTHTYLKEEVQQEQLIRTLDPFHIFLSIAAQMNGKIINYSSIARECATTDRTVKEYFQILEDTLLGFFLPPFYESIRKRQRSNPKFYLFDQGVQRALFGNLTTTVTPKTYEFGVLFENFIVNEIYRLQSYYEKDYKLSYLRTKDDAEIDLIIDRPGLPRALIEIKSSNHITKSDVLTLSKLHKDFKNAQAFCLSLDPNPKRIGNVHVLPWQQGLVELGLSN